MGGSLRHAKVPIETKLPLLLPRTHIITARLTERTHTKSSSWTEYSFALASLASAVLNILRSQSYPVPMFYQNALVVFVLSENHSWEISPGLINISSGRYRGAKLSKTYSCIFLCCAVKAVHIDLVSDLSSEAFTAAFRRFVARRGRCSKIYSDCGITFVGANTQLQEILKQAPEQLIIIWHFNLHFDGLSEAAVKSIKFHLFHVIGERRLNYEERSPDRVVIKFFSALIAKFRPQ